jgi:hypothetical protein
MDVELLKQAQQVGSNEEKTEEETRMVEQMIA